MYTEFKFGVLYYRQGQTNEDDMFGNGTLLRVIIVLMNEPFDH